MFCGHIVLIRYSNVMFVMTLTDGCVMTALVWLLLLLTLTDGFVVIVLVWLLLTLTCLSGVLSCSLRGLLRGRPGSTWTLLVLVLILGLSLSLSLSSSPHTVPHLSHPLPTREPLWIVKKREAWIKVGNGLCQPSKMAFMKESTSAGSRSTS